MLKVVSVKEPSSTRIEFGEYVLLNVEFDNERLPPAPFYWRTGDFVGSLVEVGINRKSGAVAKVGLIAYGEPKSLFSESKYWGGVSIAGIPILNVDGWPIDRYKDEVGYFTVEESELCFVLLFSPDNAVQSVYESFGVRFGVNSNYDLVWIAVKK
ncbi:hypothetical protein [Pseudomonas frederiksbergensis]|uniref:Uncharacterized protein n=1 Tax=Pseudomonas frederiksbergensis TaxID=104087 RepID=A0A423KKP6_9PSED|nr:hypothetical protein [Pseudomonas frederiksbergensis]RON53981.1 hypothetical protein BK665_12955 [Pseudomonas frederiksbergensis]